MVVGTNALELVEHMFCAVGRPQGEKMVVGIQQRATASHCDESGVSLRWQDHQPTLLPSVVAPANRIV
jgi:hypothetical protein